MKKDQTVELRLRKEMPFLSGKLAVLEAGMKLSLISPFSGGQIHVCWGIGGKEWHCWHREPAGKEAQGLPAQP